MTIIAPDPSVLPLVLGPEQLAVLLAVTAGMLAWAARNRESRRRLREWWTRTGAMK